MEDRALTNKPIILFGAGVTGEKALAYYGRRNVCFFVDNYREGTYYCGKPVISADDLKNIYKDYTIIVSAKPEYIGEIMHQLESLDIRDVILYDPLDEMTSFVSNPRLQALKNIHKGKRCFLIGNGPSLKAEDLDVIAQNGDISFASNAIYKLYPSTKWRPDYYCVNDEYFMLQHWDDIASLKSCNLFLCNIKKVSAEMTDKIKGKDNVYSYIERQLQYDAKRNVMLPVFEHSNEPYPAFSGDPSKFLYVGSTIMYNMMQCTAYMGFTEIILLGVDFSYVNTCNCLEKIILPRTVSNDVVSEYFCKDYHKEGNLVCYSDPNLTGMAYKKAEEYSREHGFRIYNATRGGKLEVFERVDFDSLF